jgi:hypothetical protein
VSSKAAWVLAFWLVPSSLRPRTYRSLCAAFAVAGPDALSPLLAVMYPLVSAYTSR